MIDIYRALKSKTNQKSWMALGYTSYRHRMPQGTIVVLILDLNKPSVLIERKPGLKEFQTKGTETEKLRDAKVVTDCWTLKLMDRR